jgi:hypothetical protein
MPETKKARTPNKPEDKPVKNLPNNNEEEQQKIPTSFTVSKEGVDDLVNALNEVVASKFVKQVLFNVINEHFKPVFEE